MIVQIICDNCNGTGIIEYITHGPTEADVEPIRCPACGGFGAVETADSVIAAWNKAIEIAASVADAEALNCEESSTPYDGGCGPVAHQRAAYNIAAAIRAIVQPEDDRMPPEPQVMWSEERALAERDEAFSAGLEAAADVCDECAEYYRKLDDQPCVNAMRAAAEAIRDRPRPGISNAT